ncbi:hypothetical protein SBADM41S_04514 [Streptomyces badius]
MMPSHMLSRTTGTRASGSSSCAATKGITPRMVPATVAVAGTYTAIVSANAASDAVACRPSTAVSTRPPTVDASMVR